MRIAVDSDDAGIELKRVIVEHLRDSGVDVEGRPTIRILAFIWRN
jgi:ribose 5-phosphate isomerase RpiB